MELTKTHAQKSGCGETLISVKFPFASVARCVRSILTIVPLDSDVTLAQCCVSYFMCDSVVLNSTFGRLIARTLSRISVTLSLGIRV